MYITRLGMPKTVQNGDFEKSLAKGGCQNPDFPAYSEGTFLERKQILRIFTPKPPAKTRFSPHIVKGYLETAKKFEIFIQKAPVKP